MPEGFGNSRVANFCDYIFHRQSNTHREEGLTIKKKFVWD